MDNLVGQTLLGRYRLDRFIGRGGMAMVYEAWDSKRAVSVAVKLMHDDLAEDFVFLRRFAREATTLARLKHPHIVRFLGFEEGQGRAFLVMEYVKGVSLRRHLRNLGRPLSLAETLGVLQPVCSALHYAHQLGIYHCDIKPANVFIEEGGRVLLGDFGIARLSETATVTLTTMGTPAYMSPEQCRGGIRLDGRTDIYSLGISTYELLTLDRPFKGEIAQTEGTIYERVRWEQIFSAPPSPRLVNPDLPIGVEKAVLRALEKDPEQRFQEAMGFFAAIQSGAAVIPAAITAEDTTIVEPSIGQIASYSELHQKTMQDAPALAVAQPSAAGSQQDSSAVSHAAKAQGSAAAPGKRVGKGAIIAGLAILALAVLAIAAYIGWNQFSPDETYSVVDGQNSPVVVVDETVTPEGVEKQSSLVSTAVVEELPPVTATIMVEESPTPTAEPPTMTPIPPTPEPSNLFVLYALNASNDMMDNGEFAIAEQGLAAHLQELDPAINAGFLAFGHQLRASEDGACSGVNVEMRVPIRPGNASAIWDSVLLLNPIGIAPMADALVDAHNYFGVGSGQENALILITDGESYCDEAEDTLQRVANRQRDTGQILPIYIFGIDLENDEAVLFRALLALDGMTGDFYEISSAAELTAQLENLIETLDD